MVHQEITPGYVSERWAEIARRPELTIPARIRAVCNAGYWSSVAIGRVKATRQPSWRDLPEGE